MEKLKFIPEYHDAKSYSISENFKVSEYSHFDDDEWILDIESSSGQTVKIIWRQKLSNGSWLTDASNSHLLIASKFFIHSLMIDPPYGVGKMGLFRKPITLYNIFTYLLKLIKWMSNSNGLYNRFRYLSKLAIEDYIEYVISIHNENNDDDIKVKTLSGQLSMIQLFYMQRKKLDDAIIVEPFDGLNSFDYSKTITSNFGGQIPYIPDNVIRPLVTSAVDCLNKINGLIELRDFVFPYIYDARSLSMLGCESKSLVPIDKASKKKLWTFGKDNQFLNSIIGILDKHSISHSFSTSFSRSKFKWFFSRLVNNAIAACAICILSCVGLRGCELIYLECNCVPEDNNSTFGMYDVYEISGLTFKNESAPTSATWSAGLALRGTKKLPLAIEAINALINLCAPWRKACNTNILFLVPNLAWLNTLKIKVMDETNTHRTGFSRLSGGMLNKRLLEFLSKIELPIPWKLTSHQFRKTFARFVIRNDVSTIPALSQHYLHQSIVLTDVAYVGRNFELRDLISESVELDVSMFLLNMLDSDVPISGKFGDKVTSQRNSIGKLIGTDKNSMLGTLLSDVGLSIFNSDFGMCVHAANKSSCIKQPALPLHIASAPNTCFDCDNFCATIEHKNFWLERKRNATDIRSRLQDTDLIQINLIEETINQCNVILKDINI